MPSVSLNAWRIRSPRTIREPQQAFARACLRPLALIALGVDDALYRTFRTTNPIENLNGSIAHYTRNVKRWRDGHMLLRWVASSLHEAGRGFRAVRGFRDMKRLTAALARSVQSNSAAQPKVA